MVHLEQLILPLAPRHSDWSISCQLVLRKAYRLRTFNPFITSNRHEIICTNQVRNLDISTTTSQPTCMHKAFGSHQSSWLLHESAHISTIRLSSRLTISPTIKVCKQRLIMLTQICVIQALKDHMILTLNLLCGVPIARYRNVPSRACHLPTERCKSCAASPERNRLLTTDACKPAASHHT